MDLRDSRYIVIFDGVCTFCNGAVNFIIKRDPQGLFAFTPLQSDAARELMTKYQVGNAGIDTFVLIKNGESLVFSSAALEIAKDLKGYWYLLTFFKVIPAPFRDVFYKLFARNRYRLFGRQSSCRVPSEALKSRFIGI